MNNIAKKTSALNALSLIAISLSLSACVSTLQPGNKPLTRAKADLVCQNSSRYAGRIIGDGHCVSLIKECTGAPLTSFWKPGAKVLESTLAPGTIIATFKNNRYPNREGYHAAIYIKHDARGIWVWDQWRGKAVHKRLIRTRNDGAPASNTAQAYRVVKIPKLAAP